MSSRREGNKFTTVLLVIAIAIGAYIIARLAPGYIRDYQIQNVVEMAAKFYADPAKRRTVPEYLEKKIYQLDLDSELKDFEIRRDGYDVVISHEWTYTAVFIPKNPLVPEYKRVIQFKEEARRTVDAN